MNNASDTLIRTTTDSRTTTDASAAERRRRGAVYAIVPVILFILTFLMTKKELLPVHSDVRAHMSHALSLDMVLAMDHSGWEFLCWLLYAMLPIDITTAACLITSLFNAITSAMVAWMAFHFLDAYAGRPGLNRTVGAVSVSALLVGPLYLRFYNHLYYLGQNTPNPWHNPTFIGVRPFAFAVTLLTIVYWDVIGSASGSTAGGRRIASGGFRKDHTGAAGKGAGALRERIALQIVLALLLAYSTFIKPSFLTIYLPACVLIVLCRVIRQRGKGFFRAIADHLYFVPSGLILLRQYLMYYYTGNGVEKTYGMTIDLFAAAGRYAPSVAFSWFLRMAFPLAVMLIWLRVLVKDDLFRLTSLEYVFGQLIAWVFVETGSRATHGNFGWGNMLGTSLIWVYCLLFFVQKILAQQGIAGILRLPWKARWKYLLPGMLLAWHLLAGFLYYFSLLHNLELQL